MESQEFGGDQESTPQEGDLEEQGAAQEQEGGGDQDFGGGGDVGGVDDDATDPDHFGTIGASRSMDRDATSAPPSRAGDSQRGSGSVRSAITPKWSLAQTLSTGLSKTIRQSDTASVGPPCSPHRTRT